MPLLGALDQGTTSTRFIVFDEMGNIISQAQLEHQQILPEPGWVEHDAMEIWNNTKQVIISALNNGNLKPNELSAIGLANQRETIVAWDKKTGLPLTNAIVWQDMRTHHFISQFSADIKEQIVSRTGLMISPYFSASKMSWLISNIPAIQEALSQDRLQLGTIDSWLLWNLTGGVRDGSYFTDVTNASRTQLMDIRACEWDKDLLSYFNVPRTVLPEIRSSSEIFGYTEKGGFLENAIPVAGLLGDQQAALVGQACFKVGESKTTYGTGNFLLTHTGEKIVRSSSGLLSTVAYKLGTQETQYALEGSVAVTGSAIQWLRDELHFFDTSSQIESLAQEVPDAGGVYFIPAFSGLYAPHWMADVRGTILGMTRKTNKAHLARATLEAICYQTRDVLEAMASEIGTPLHEIRVDGGITANEFCMQMQSDVMGIQVVKPKILETTALGASYVAGLAVGIYDGTEQLAQLWQEDRRWKPDKRSTLSGLGYLNWKRALDSAKTWRV